MADEMDKSGDGNDKDRAPEEQSGEGIETGSDGEGTAEMSAPRDREDASISASGDGEGEGGSRSSSTPADAGAPLAPQANATPPTPASTASQAPAMPTGRGEPLKAEARSANPADSSQSPSGGLDAPGLDLLYDVELDATLQFGSKEMLLRDVLELGPGDVVELDRHIAEPVDLVVGDRIVARGEVVVASGNFALRVTEVATPQMRLESIRCLF